MSLTESHRRPLRREFWSLCGAGLASSVGDGAVFVGFPILASTLTRDPRLLAGVAVAQRLPWLVFSLLTGALADRLDRRRLIGVVEVLRMVAVVGLGAAVAGHFHPLAAIYLAAFSLGSLETAFTGSLGAIIPQLVQRSELGRANGYLYAAQMSGEGILGPATGGLLAAAALSLPFLFDGATFALSAAVILVLLPRQAKAGAPAEPLAGAGRAPGSGAARLGVLVSGMRADVAAGLRWFVGDPAVRLVAGFIAVLAFCQAAVFSVLVLWAEGDLHVSRVGYGLLLTVAAFGTVGAATVTGRVMDRFAPARLVLAAGAVAAGAYVVLGLTHSVVLAAAAMVCEGAAVSWGNVVSFALRQMLIPSELLGRVGNAMRMCIYGAMPLGAAAGGLLAHSIGLRGMLVAAGALQLGVVGLLGRPLVRALAAAPAETGEAEPVIDLVDTDALSGLSREPALVP